MNANAEYKKLVRPTDDRKIAGVASGFARYLGLDPVLVRLIFVILAVCAFTGVIVYLAGWILMPDDEPAHSADLPPGMTT